MPEDEAEVRTQESEVEVDPEQTEETQQEIQDEEVSQQILEMRDIERDLHQRMDDHVEQIDLHLETGDEEEARKHGRLYRKMEQGLEQIRMWRSELEEAHEEGWLTRKLERAARAFMNSMESLVEEYDELVDRFQEQADTATKLRSEAALRTLRVEDARERANDRLFHNEALNSQRQDEQVDELLEDRREQLDEGQTELPTDWDYREPEPPDDLEEDSPDPDPHPGEPDVPEERSEAEDDYQDDPRERL